MKPSPDSRQRVFSVVGDRYHFFVTGNETGGAYSAFDAHVPPGHGPPPHVHTREDEVFHVLEGEFTFTSGDESLTLGPGQTFLGKRGLPHAFRNSGSVPGRLIIAIHPAGLENFFMEAGTPLESPESQPVAPTDEDIRRLIALAPQYGVEIFAGPPNAGA